MKLKLRKQTHLPIKPIYYRKKFFWARWKTRGRGPGVRGTGSWGTGSRGVENAGCGKHGVWKTRGVENAGCGKCGVWKTRGVENAGSGGKRGENVFSPKYEFCSLKMRSRNFVILKLQ